MDVQMADVQMAVVQCDPQPPKRTRGLPSCAPGAYRLSRHGSCAHGGREWTADAGRFGYDPQGSAEAPDPAAVFTWSEEQLLELATSLAAMRTIRHRPRGLRQRTCTILKERLQHNTHCHHHWAKRRGPSRLRLLLPDGPGWVPRCLCGPMRVANKRMVKS